MMSVPKSFAGLLALIAIEKGLSREGDLVAEWILERKRSTAFSGAIVQPVMDMTNSMTFSEIYDDPQSDIRKYSQVIGLREVLTGEVVVDSLYDYLLSLKRDSFKHGEAFVYQAPKAEVFNWITNRVTRRSLEEYMHQIRIQSMGVLLICEACKHQHCHHCSDAEREYPKR